MCYVCHDLRSGSTLAMTSMGTSTTSNWSLGVSITSKAIHDDRYQMTWPGSGCSNNLFANDELGACIRSTTVGSMGGSQSAILPVNIG
jgi:hypothetical protein